MNRIELAKKASTTKCKRRGCSKKVSLLVLKENDTFCSVGCFHTANGGNPWKQDDDYEDPTFTRNTPMTAQISDDIYIDANA